jgi:CBS domain-containing protein
MTSRVTCVSPEDTIEECMSLVTHKRIRHLPVMEGGELVGIISIGDLVRVALDQKNFMIEQLEGYITSG